MSDKKCNASVISFQMTYPLLNLNLYTYSRSHYDMLLVTFRVNEYNKGYYAKKIGKPTRKGTSITFAAFTSTEKADREKDILIALQDEYISNKNNNKNHESEES